MKYNKIELLEGNFVLYQGMVCRVSGSAGLSISEKIAYHIWEEAGYRPPHEVLGRWVMSDEITPITETEATFYRLKKVPQS